MYFSFLHQYLPTETYRLVLRRSLLPASHTFAIKGRNSNNKKSYFLQKVDMSSLERLRLIGSTLYQSVSSVIYWVADNFVHNRKGVIKHSSVSHHHTIHQISYDFPRRASLYQGEFVSVPHHGCKKEVSYIHLKG